MELQRKRAMLIARAGALITAIYALLCARLRVLQSERPQISYGPMSIRDEERQRNLNMIYNYNDTECVNMLRMRRMPFFTLCNLLRDRKLVLDNINSCVEEQVAMFLDIVGHNQRFRVVKNNWRRSIETVHRHFKDVLYAIENATEILNSCRSDTYDTTKGDIQVGSKRKRSLLGEEDLIVLGGMSEAVKEVASAIRETKVLDCHPDLYGAIMFIPGFTEEALMCASGHLLEYKALGTSFVQWSDAHKVLWLRTYLAKHYYI